ncbi:MAG: glycosyltransferase [Puniceicoccales bacterium]|jgi:undecaprenyl-phosphate 4-deoxy-4-formamido-L-arabinose transferase|nr:glycosyltransferase [Puniceicoccales bacterium]
MSELNTPNISVVVPVYNEELNIDELCSRLVKVLETAKRSFEIIVVNDGSRDCSMPKLLEWYNRYPNYFRILEFNCNFGHHNAILAGFEHVRGDITITLDADLQNPPEEIPKLLEKMDEGYDYVGSYRLGKRQDVRWRCWASKFNNKIRAKITDIQMSDQGCMFRAYKRSIIDAIVRCGDYTAFIPALAYKFSSRYTEVGMRHAPRFKGESKYGLYYLLRTHFDWMTGFSLVPLQLFTLFGFALAGFSFLLVLYILGRRLCIGPEAEGLFTLFAILFFMLSVVIVGIGLIGEYVGRTYQIIQKRPRYILKNIYQQSDDNTASKK